MFQVDRIRIDKKNKGELTLSYSLVSGCLSPLRVREVIGRVVMVECE
jgi:hypothetical protein